MTRPVPVILCGGSGTRLWPVSTPTRPKQFAALVSDVAMLTATAARVADQKHFAQPIVVAGADHGEQAAMLIRAAGAAPAPMILEPAGRNTAPALVAAALEALARDTDAVIVVLPADHLIGDVEAFHRVLARAVAAARAGRIVTLGIRPYRPETGYGYILAGEPEPGIDGVRKLVRFVEKPDEARAASYLADGRYFWNAGIFVAEAATVMAEAERLAPAVVSACRLALARSERRADDVMVLHADSLAASPAVSFDVAVMEGTDRGAVVPADIGWSDVGSWQAVYEARRSSGDAAGNVAPPDALLIDSRNCLVAGGTGQVALIGVENLAVIRSEDGLLICDLDRSQDVKAVSAALE